MYQSQIFSKKHLEEKTETFDKQKLYTKCCYNIEKHYNRLFNQEIKIVQVEFNVNYINVILNRESTEQNRQFADILKNTRI